jgi:hypothetical protein
VPKPSDKEPKQAAAPAAEQNSSPDIAALLTQYGVTTVPKPVYEWGGYRYTNATDAIAAAKRGAAA